MLNMFLSFKNINTNFIANQFWIIIALFIRNNLRHTILEVKYWRWYLSNINEFEYEYETVKIRRSLEMIII